MTDETLRSKNRWAIWAAVAICLAPLVPYAVRGDRAPAPTRSGTPATTQMAPSAAPSY